MSDSVLNIEYTDVRVKNTATTFKGFTILLEKTKVKKETITHERTKLQQ